MHNYLILRISFCKLTFKNTCIKCSSVVISNLKEHILSLLGKKQVVVITQHNTKFVRRYGIVNVLISVFIGSIVAIFVVRYNKYKNYNNYAVILKENEILKKQYDDIENHFKEVLLQVDKVNEYLKVNNTEELKIIDAELKSKKIKKSNEEMKQILNKKLALSYDKLNGRKKYIAYAVNKLGISNIQYNKIVKTAKVSEYVDSGDVISNTTDEKFIGGEDNEVRKIKMVKTKPLLKISPNNINHINYKDEIGRLIDIENTISMLPFGVPTDSGYRITSSYGFRDLKNNGEIKLHSGVDIVLNNDKVLSTSSGVVQFAGKKQGYGNCVEIDHTYGKKYIITRYAHLKSIAISQGQVINNNYYIGEQGDTGHVTGKHLHYEVIIGGVNVNPDKFIKVKSIDDF